MTKKRIYNDNYQYTKDGLDLSIELDHELDIIIAKYVEQFDRTEFEHLMVSELFTRFSYYWVKKKIDSKK